MRTEEEFLRLADERDEWKRRAELEAVSAYDLLARAAKAEAERDAARAEAAEQRANKDAAYSERNQLVALLSTMFPAGRRETDIEGWDPEWSNCVYIDLPTGQASWHYRRDEMPLFVHLDLYSKPWDEHSTGEKYARVALLRAQNVEGGLPPDPRIEAWRALDAESRKDAISDIRRLCLNDTDLAAQALEALGEGR